MFFDPWTSGRLAAFHREDLARVAAVRQAGGEAAAPVVRRRLMARRLGELLIAAGRRLTGDGPGAPVLVGGARLPH